MEYDSISISLLKKLLFLLIAYILGYLQCSLMWLVIPVILQIIKEKRLNRKLVRSEFHRSVIRDGEKDVIGSLSDLPAWVCFPDMERVEWINQIIKKIWPNVNNYVHDIIKQLLQEKLNKKLGKYKLSGMVFDKLIMGTVPFRIGGITVYENVSRDEIVTDMDILYAGDCEISLKFGKLKGGIKDFQIYGKLRVVIKPLIDTLPLVGGLQVFFLNPPEIEFNLEGLAGVLELPGLNDLLKKLILDTICSVIVLPNKFPFILSKKVSKEDITIPNPQGVLRIHVVQAKKLMKRDLTFSGTLTSDPYAVVTIGDQEYKTPVKGHTAKPKWDYWCEFIIEEINGVFMFISLWDHDTLQNDEQLGRTKVLVSKLMEKKTADMWLNLENVKHGEVQIRSTWLTLSRNHDDLNTVLEEIQKLQVPNLNSAILTVFVESADLSTASSQKLEPYVEIKLETQVKTTKIIKKESNPVWEEGFTFLVTNPENNYIDFKIIDSKAEKTIGVFVYNVEALFGMDNLNLENQTFKMLECESESTITISMQLRDYPERLQPHYTYFAMLDRNLAEYGSFNKPRVNYGTRMEPEEQQNIVNSVLKNPSFKSPDNRSNSSTSGDESLENQTETDNSKDPVLLEHFNLSRSSSVSSINDDNVSTKSDFLSQAKIKLTLRYSVQRQRLIVVVHHLEDLTFDEIKGLYVKLYLLPERNKDTKRRTQVIRTSKNPVYDETFEYVMSQDDLCNKHLEVSVCEEKVLKNEPIEKVVIDLDKLSLVLPFTRLFVLFRKSHQS